MHFLLVLSYSRKKKNTSLFCPSSTICFAHCTIALYCPCASFDVTFSSNSHEFCLLRNCCPFTIWNYICKEPGRNTWVAAYSWGHGQPMCYRKVGYNMTWPRNMITAHTEQELVMASTLTLDWCWENCCVGPFTSSLKLLHNDSVNLLSWMWFIHPFYYIIQKTIYY